MTNVQKLTVRASEIRARLSEIAEIPELTDEHRGELNHAADRVPGHRGPNYRPRSRPKVTPSRSRWGRVAAPKIAPTATCAAGRTSGTSSKH